MAISNYTNVITKAWRKGEIWSRDCFLMPSIITFYTAKEQGETRYISLDVVSSRYGIIYLKFNWFIVLLNSLYTIALNKLSHVIPIVIEIIK